MSTWPTTTCIAGRWPAMHKWERYWNVTKRRPGYIEEVYKRIEVDGPVASGDLSERVGKKGTWWDWDDAKVALEHLFWSGEVTATRRPNDFARVYDLTERVIPAEVLARPGPTRTQGPQATARTCGSASRHSHVRGSDRLPPSEERAVQTVGRRAGRGGHAARGGGRGLDEGGLPSTTRPASRGASTPARC